jgi:hypothetical protein
MCAAKRIEYVRATAAGADPHAILHTTPSDHAAARHSDGREGARARTHIKRTLVMTPSPRPLSAVLLLVCLPLAGCIGLTAAQKDATLKFASVATDLGTASSSELTKMHDETIVMNVAMYRLPDLSIENRQPIIVTEIANRDYENLASRFAGNWYDVFSAGPQALKAYGEALTAIINADNSTKVKQSADSLAAALKAIPGSPITAATQSAVSALSAQLTEWALASMKSHAVHTIVIKYDADVATVCKLIGDNFFIAPPGQHQPDNFAEDFQAIAQTLVASSKTAMDLHPNDRLIRSDSLSSWMTAQQHLTEVKTVFPTIVKTSAACASANAALVKALGNDAVSLKDIEAFYADGKQLQSSIKTLSAN